MATQLAILSGKLAAKFGMEGGDQELLSILKATAFKGQANDSQMAALLIVAGQYGLNPFTKEIYAFPDQNNGIVPVVGVDGWSRIINENSQFDGLDFEQDDDKCTCIMYRKDRSHPIKVTEYMSECKREAKPWKSHPKRMLRHKALIQCARLAFGYVGIYDEDEAERIIEKDMGSAKVVDDQPPAPTMYPEADFNRLLPTWLKAIDDGKKTAADIIATVETKGKLTDNQKAKIKREPITGEIINAEVQS